MIAAGEVVEGPSSVVKELIENSLDAGSLEISVQVADSGLKRITVTDNGSGIHPDDLKLAVCEHATSKIADVHDIETVESYGFRGEALASISSISDVTILTRSAAIDTGARLENARGSVKVSPYAGPSGTTVIVENLFYNVPARRKFLKAPRTELKNVREVFIRAAIPAWRTSFSFENDGKRTITLPPASNQEERLKQVFGVSEFEGLLFDSLEDLKVRISGFFSKPDRLRGSRSMQYLFVNGRPVENRYLGFLLSRAYEAVAPHGRHPAAVIFIDIEPSLVDVNIHPAKREVRLFDQRYIDSLIIQLAGKVLNRVHSAGENLFSGINRGGDDGPAEEGRFRPRTGGAVPAENGGFVQGRMGFSFDRASPDSAGVEVQDGPLTIRETEEFYRTVTGADFAVIGVAFDTYIIAQKGESLYFIDFHAAHERFIYDTLAGKGMHFESQELMFPAVIELSPGDYAVLMDNIEYFAGLSFEIEEFGGSTAAVRAVPELGVRFNVERFVKDAIESIKGETAPDDIRKRIAASAACHSARRAGDRLAPGEADIICGRVFSGDVELRCPHGRPFVHMVEKDSLEKMFKRQL